MPNQAKISPQERSLNWFLRTYLPPEDIIHRVRGLKEYAYILHNKDIKSDGTPDVEHSHVIMCFHSQHTCNSLCNTIEIVADLNQRDYNFFLTPIGQTRNDNLARCYGYLMHLNNPDKTPYSKEDIVTSSYEYFETILSRSSNDTLREEGNTAFVTDLLTAHPLEMAKRYGRDYIKNFSNYNSWKQYILNSFDGDMTKINEILKG